MKRKLIITAFMLLICSIMIFGAKQLQKASSPVQNTDVSSSGPAETVQGVNDDAVGSSEAAAPKIEAQAQVKASTPEPQKSTNVSSNTSSGSKEQTSTGTSKNTGGDGGSEKPAAAVYNLVIKDTISGKVINEKLNFDGQKLLYDLLLETLADAKKKGEISGYMIDNSGYVKMINGLWEKKPEPSSGWLYYINGNKVDYGIRDDRARFPSGTTVEFRFYRDALNEK